MIRTHFQSSFPVQSLSTGEFVWAKDDSWESNEIDYFAQSMGEDGSNATSGFFTTSGTRKRILPIRLGRWVLREARADRSCHMAAELWELSGSFSQLYLIVGNRPDVNSSHLDLPNSLIFFVTAIAIGSKADVIRIVPASRSGSTVIGTIAGQFGGDSVQIKSIISPTSLEWACLSHSPAFLRLDSAMIDAHAWMRDFGSENARASLEYLEKRMRPKPSLDRPRSQKGFRSIFSGQTRRRSQRSKKRS